MPAAGEGDLHMVRQDIISNKSLLLCANKLNLPTYIQSKPFVTKVWEPVVQQAPSVQQASGTQQTPSEPSTPNKPTENDDGPPVRVHAYRTECSLWTYCLVQPTKRSKKQKQKDEQDFQWIGDKVTLALSFALQL